ncbi:MAG: lytic transglycosylase domain-containing protein [Sphingobacteriia bacterium]
MSFIRPITLGRATVLVLLVCVLLLGYWLWTAPPSAQAGAPLASARATGPLALGELMPDQPNFCGEPVPIQDPEVRERFDREFMLNVYDYATITMILKRLERWKKPMLEILTQYDVPADFLYLMVAESAVRNATSLAGAQGYWQFMPQTGLDYGLIQNAYVDERNHPLKSTRAACNYLKSSYKKFGSWTLAAASYNMGAGGVAYGQQSQCLQGFYHLYLNDETSRYLFRILAYKYILQHPEQYGYRVPPSERYQPLAYRTLAVTRSIDDLAAWARTQGLDYRTLNWYNPWLKSYSLPVAAGQRYELWLPLQQPRLGTYRPPADSTPPPQPGG